MESIPLMTILSKLSKNSKITSIVDSIGQEGDKTKVRRDKTEQHRPGG